MSIEPDAINQRIETLLSDADDINSEIRTFATTASQDDGKEIRLTPETQEMRDDILMSYEQWYNAGLVFVSDYLPGRVEDFNEHYKNITNRLLFEEQEWNSYTTWLGRVMNHLQAQKAIIGSIPTRVELERYRTQKEVSRKITSDEIQRSRSLYDEGNIRAAGVISGVALERHLLTMCEMSDKDIEFGYMDGIASLAQTLQDEDMISDDDQRLLEYLAGIRNKCSHANEDEPPNDDVKRLISESEQFIREQ